VSNGGISAEVERFIQDNIPSVEQLEVLLLLFGAPDKEWSAAQVSQSLHRQAQSVGMCLLDLQRRGLLSVAGEPPLYHYDPGAQREVVRSLDRTYRERPVSVVEIIFAPGRDSLRAFSDAFKIRRQD
jgi:hypothetical protein